MTLIVKDYPALTKALQSRGFFLVTDLPQGTRVDRQRGRLVVRMP